MKLAFYVSLILSICVLQSCKTTSSFTYDFDQFIGEKVRLNQSYSTNLSIVDLSIVLPENHKLLVNASPYLQLFTTDKLIKKYSVLNLNQQILLNEKINSDVLFAELHLTYCKEGKDGLCLIQKVLYEINLLENEENQVIQLEYKVSDSSF